MPITGARPRRRCSGSKEESPCPSGRFPASSDDRNAACSHRDHLEIMGIDGRRSTTLFVGERQPSGSPTRRRAHEPALVTSAKSFRGGRGGIAQAR